MQQKEGVVACGTAPLLGGLVVVLHRLAARLRVRRNTSLLPHLAASRLAREVSQLVPRLRVLREVVVAARGAALQLLRAGGGKGGIRCAV